jgi:hypothetical protein
MTASTTFYLYAHGVRIGTLKDVSKEEARDLCRAEERERGETVVLYDRLFKPVPMVASYR